MPTDLVALEDGKLDERKISNGSPLITMPARFNGMPMIASRHSTSQAFFCDRYRYFILVLGLACLTSISSNMVIHNFTVIVMSPASKEHTSHQHLESLKNATTVQIAASTLPPPQMESLQPVQIVSTLPPPLPQQKQQQQQQIQHDIKSMTFDYTIEQKGWLNWVVAIGSILGTFPFNALYGKYGARWVLFAGGILSAVATALIPFAAARVGFVSFVFLRFVQGIAYSANFAATGMICVSWASMKQNAFFISVLTGYTPLSSTITNVVSGWLSESSFGWPSAFYTHAAVSLVLFAAWAFFYDDRPKDSHFVSDVELEKINRGKSASHINLDTGIPYKAILTDGLVWTCWLNAFLYLLAVIFMFSYIPTYFNYVLGYDVEKTGVMGALPGLAQVPMKIAFGIASDKYDCCPERVKMIVYNTMAVALPGLMFIAISYVPEGYPFAVVFIFICVNICLSAACGGFYKTAALYARQYSHFVIANIQFSKSISLFVAPAMMTVFVTDESDRSQWRVNFIILAVSLFTANILYSLKATTRPATFVTAHEENMHRLPNRGSELAVTRESSSSSDECTNNEKRHF